VANATNTYIPTRTKQDNMYDFDNLIVVMMMMMMIYYSVPFA
jgi:hypothetical protein